MNMMEERVKIQGMNKGGIWVKGPTSSAGQCPEGQKDPTRGRHPSVHPPQYKRGRRLFVFSDCIIIITLRCGLCKDEFLLGSTCA